MGFGEFIERDLGNVLCNLHRESESFKEMAVLDVALVVDPIIVAVE